MAVVFIQGIIPALSMITMQKIINNLQTEKATLKAYIFLVLIYIGIDILDSIISSFYNLYYTKFSAEFDKYIKVKLLEKAVSLSLKDFENSETFNIINRAKSQGGQNILEFYVSFTTALKVIVKISSSVLILSSFKTWMIFAVLIFPVFKYLYSLKIGEIQYNIHLNRTDKERALWYTDYLIMTGIAFKEIKLYGISQFLIKKFNDIKDSFIKQDMKVLKKSAIVNVILTLGDQIISGFIFLYLIAAGLKQIILIGDVITYTKCTFSIKNDMEGIFGILSNIVKNSLFIDFLFNFFSLNETRNENGKIKIDKIESIRLDSISYKYENSEKFALNNISFSVSPNNLLAIVGKNGTGKSTLIKIILGFYNDYEGKIYINNIDFKDIDKVSYQKRIGCVFQDYIKYETTLRENIVYGDINNIDDDKRIFSVLERAQINPQLFQDNDLDIMLGNWFGNKQISIGEWQRLAIARSFFRKADLYIMDEPDASLDVVAEMDMLNTYKSVFKDHLGIFITHKIKQVNMLADEIIVLDDNCMVEKGTHSELMRLEGVYFTLFNAQNEDIKMKI